MNKKNIIEQEQKALTAYLKSLFAPGKEIYRSVLHVSASGMSREIGLYIVKDNRILDISFEVASVLGWTKSKTKRAVRVEGCGMDMIFHTIYELSQRLFNDGYVLKQVNL